MLDDLHQHMLAIKKRYRFNLVIRGGPTQNSTWGNIVYCGGCHQQTDSYPYEEVNLAAEELGSKCGVASPLCPAKRRRRRAAEGR